VFHSLLPRPGVDELQNVQQYPLITGHVCFYTRRSGKERRTTRQAEIDALKKQLADKDVRISIEKADKELYFRRCTEFEAKLEIAVEALAGAEEFVDRHSESWYISGQALLAEIREALAKIRSKP